MSTRNKGRNRDAGAPPPVETVTPGNEATRESGAAPGNEAAPATETAGPPTAPPDPEQEFAALTGTVTDEDGIPIVGASVEVYHDGVLVTGAATDLHGRYLVLRLAAGPRYELRCAAVGYTPVGEGNVELRAATRHTRYFTLPACPEPAEVWRPDPAYAAVARSVRRRWGVPASVLLALYAVRSKQRAGLPGNNPLGVRAQGTEPRDAEGYAVFTSVPHAFLRMGQILGAREPYAAATREYRSDPSAKDALEKFIAAVASDETEFGTLLLFISEHNLHQFDKDKS